MSGNEMTNVLKQIGIDLELDNPFEKEQPDSYEIFSYEELVGEDDGKIDKD